MTDNDAAAAPAAQYACYKCRRILFSSASLLQHEPGHVNAATFSGKKPANSALSHSVCSSYFADPDSFAVGAFTDNEGKLNCPHCRCKLGGFTWSGEQCSCGHWVTPAFMFSKSKVDEKRAGMAADGRKAGGGLRAPVIVFKPQLDDAVSSASGSGEDERKQVAEGDVNQLPAIPVLQHT